MHGQTIRAAREAANMTQDRLAEAAGLSKRTVLRAEGGKPMSKETAAALSSVLGLDLSTGGAATPAMPDDPLLAEILSRGETVLWEGRPDRADWERINLPHLWYALHHAMAAVSITMVPVYAWLLAGEASGGAWTGVGLAAVGMGVSGWLGVRTARSVGFHRRKLELMDRTRLVASDVALYQETLETDDGSATVLRTPLGRGALVRERAAYLMWPRARVVEVGRPENPKRYIVGVPGLAATLREIRSRGRA